MVVATMRLLYHSVAVYLSLSATPVWAAPNKHSDHDLEPCTIVSPISGNFFDLSALNIPDPETSTAKHPRTNSWNTTGHDLGYNFTMNFCGPVIEPLHDVVGVDKDMRRNVSAYYRSGGKTFALGLENSTPIFRGKKIVLNYTNGSPCDDSEYRRSERSSEASSGSSPGSSKVRRKSTVISLLCDKDPAAPTLTLSFIGSTDECSYFFEARTPAACPTINVKETVSPASVFGIILLIGIVVYLVGGCVYSRMVLQQRGWRQFPNYNLWATVFDFARDIFVIVFSSCLRLIPGSRKGAHRVGVHQRGQSGGARGDNDAENRLIDELNEEWDD